MYLKFPPTFWKIGSTSNSSTQTFPSAREKGLSIFPSKARLPASLSNGFTSQCRRSINKWFEAITSEIRSALRKSLEIILGLLTGFQGTRRIHNWLTQILVQTDSANQCFLFFISIFSAEICARRVCKFVIGVFIARLVFWSRVLFSASWDINIRRMLRFVESGSHCAMSFW